MDPVIDPLRARLDSMAFPHPLPPACGQLLRALETVLDLCDAPTTLIAFTSENQRTPVVKADRIRDAIASALGVELPE